MTQDEALKLALEVLEEFGEHRDVCPRYPTYAEPENYPPCNCGFEKAITAIREALAQPEQEPVAWITKNGKGWLRWHRPEDNEKNKDSIPLYTTPPQRKPLTDDELYKVFPAIATYHEANKTLYRSIARAIEAAHGIKE